MLVQVAQIGGGLSILGDVQTPPGHGPWHQVQLLALH